MCQTERQTKLDSDHLKLLEQAKFDENCHVFTIDFKSLFTNIPVEDTINSIKELVLEYDNGIPIWS